MTTQENNLLDEAPKCFCCKEHTLSIITIERSPICIGCYRKFYGDITLVQCVQCLHITSDQHGCTSAEGFMCGTCIQDELHVQYEDLLNDPAHKDIPIDDIFEPIQVKKSCFDMLPKSNYIKQLFTKLRSLCKSQKESSKSSEQ